MEIRRENLSIDDYSKMIDLEPNNYDLYIYRGLLYGNNGDYNKARDDFTKAIQLNQYSFEAYNNRGNIYRLEKLYDLAITDFSMCININPTAVQGYINRGSTYDDLHDYMSAIQDFTQALKIVPTDYEIYLFRWKAYNALGEENLATDDLEKALIINPFTTEQWLNRYTNQPLNPDSPESHIQNGIELLGSHDYNSAIDEFTKAIKLGSRSDAIAYNNRGMAHDAKKEYVLAIEDYKKALAINPEYTKVYSNLGIAYWNIQEYDTAIENLTQAIEYLSKSSNLNTDDTRIFLNSLFYRGFSYKETKKLNLAKEDYKKLLSINPNDFEVKRLLTDISAM